MFRFVIAALAVVGLASLFTGGSALGIGALILAPFFFIAKVVFFMMMFGFFARAFGHGGRYTPGRDRAAAFGNWGDSRANSRPYGRGPRATHWMQQGRAGRWQPESNGPSDEEKFDEWHRMTHARQEVDGWVEDLEQS